MQECEPSTFPGGSSASLDNVTIIMAGATEGEVTVAAAFMVVEEGTVEAEEGVVTDVVRRPHLHGSVDVYSLRLQPQGGK